MRYKIIDIYHHNNTQHYIAKCLKQNSPQYITLESQRTLCKELDIIDVDLTMNQATWATGEKIALNILHKFDHLEKLYDLNES
ncbi:MULTISPECIES: hypothetical protein [Acinetobacter]|uniref:Uncharacterized protein n=1 Tax=Acinetobacter piscicola TaxID=2006115 RepID=A0A7S7AHN0_9GAMM|nr:MULTISPECIES: hypothetical protein [Acinetobacter]QOW45856.1 hypothetical protein G0028_08090 [Acinetobacter piscicola]